MAKIYAGAEGFNEVAPEITDFQKDKGFDFEAYEAACEKYLADVKLFCRKESNCPHAGEMMNFPVGDGYAMYVVFNYTSFFHIATGDAYCISEAHARGFRKADIVRQVEAEKQCVAFTG